MADKQVVSKSVSYKTATEDDEGQRLDNYLARILKGVPRSMLYRILRKGEVRVNKGRVNPSYKIKAGDSIRIPPVTVTEGPVTIPSSNLHLVQDLKDRILFENKTPEEALNDLMSRSFKAESRQLNWPGERREPLFGQG